MDEIFVAIDVGSSKTAVVIAENTDCGPVVRGFGVSHSEGVVRGIVVNIEKSEQGILRALTIAEKQAQLKVKQLWTAFGGNQTKVFKSHGVANIPRERGIVNPTDVARLIEAAKSVPLLQNTQIIDYAVNDLIVDGRRGIIDPVGMTASRLEGDVLIFVSQIAPVSNLMRAFQDTSIIPVCVCASTIAAAQAMLTDEEKELGSVLIDIGSSTTDAIVFKNNRPQIAVTIPYAGESVTHDLMVGLKLSRNKAEEVKQSHGCAVEKAVPARASVKIMDVEGGEPRPVKKRFIAMIMQARLEEIFSLIRSNIDDGGWKLDNETLPAGAVIVGGSSQIPELDTLGTQVFDMPVRIGLPGDTNPVPADMNTPEYHVAWGAILIAEYRQKIKDKIELEHGKITALWNKVKRWVLNKL